jgi:hypothetical protein
VAHQERFALPSPSWRILCAFAAVCSLIAAVATQLHASNNYEEHIGRAQEIKVSLEMLEVAITLNHLNHHESTSQYLESSRAPPSSRVRSNPFLTGKPFAGAR